MTMSVAIVYTSTSSQKSYFFKKHGLRYFKKNTHIQLGEKKTNKRSKTFYRKKTLLQDCERPKQMEKYAIFWEKFNIVMKIFTKMILRFTYILFGFPKYYSEKHTEEKQLGREQLIQISGQLTLGGAEKRIKQGRSSQEASEVLAGFCSLNQDLISRNCYNVSLNCTFGFFFFTLFDYLFQNRAFEKQEYQ